VLNPSYPIETERLLLRPCVAADAEPMHAYKSREDVCRYLPHRPLTRDEVARRIATQYGNTTLDDEGQALTLAVVERASDRMIGDVILFWRSREHQGGEIGYVFDPSLAGRGYATEAAAQLLRLGFGTSSGLSLHRIVARLDARNTPSARVAERLGMRQEAHFVQNERFKGEWTDELVYAILAGEWHANSMLGS
jgi:RimJ/RimL family protein N-acetyltransferase